MGNIWTGDEKLSITVAIVSRHCRSSNFRDFSSRPTGEKKTTRICNYCHENGHTLKWCRKKMRDEEKRRIRFDESSKKNISPIKNSFTEKFNRRPPNDHTMSNCLDLDDRNSPTIGQLSNEEANCQHEAEPLTPPERRFFPRNNGMSFNLAELTSIGESDGELFDPLLLGY